VDLSLYKPLRMAGKCLKPVALFISSSFPQSLLMDVNKPSAIAGQICVGLIHRYLDSNLRI
jgi:hypothetical protein